MEQSRHAERPESLWRTRIAIAITLVTITTVSLGGTGEQTDEPAEEWRQPAVQTAQPSTFTREQLLAMVEAVRKGTGDFQVTFESVRVPAQTNMINRERATVVIKGGKTYIDHRYSQDPNAPLHSFRRISAFNGDRTTLVEPSRSLASVQDGPNRELDTQRHEFFNLNLLNAPRGERPAVYKQGFLAGLDNALSGKGSGRDDQSLVSLLRNGNATVRPFLEKIAGRDCHVIDCGPFTVWLDAQRGAVPLRQVFYDRANPQQILMAFLAEKVAQVAPGTWMVTRGRKINNPTAGSAVLTGGLETILMVEGWFRDSPAFHVNRGVPDGFFDFWRQLPPGTELWDKDSGRTRIVTLEDAATRALEASGRPTAQSRGMLGSPGGLILLTILAGVLPALACWRICARAGLPRVLSLLMLVPVANVILLLYVAFAGWPALRQPHTS